MNSAFFRGLEKVPTFLVPIINPPFADNSPHLSPGGRAVQNQKKAGAEPQLKTLSSG
jgi:hypothetical protein